uniref:Uncharacterized protein n=1 Tax=Anguilla anguilla TaxID=7936 RepID=A0A0E9QFK6_ANGAN
MALSISKMQGYQVESKIKSDLNSAKLNRFQPAPFNFATTVITLRSSFAHVGHSHNINCMVVGLLDALLLASGWMASRTTTLMRTVAIW